MSIYGHIIPFYVIFSLNLRIYKEIMEFKVKLRDFVGSEVIFPITVDSEEEAWELAKNREEVADAALTASSESVPNFVKGDIPGKSQLHDYEIVSIEKVREAYDFSELYGFWIDPNGGIHEITDHMGHADWIYAEENFIIEFIGEDDYKKILELDDELDRIDALILEGFIRVDYFEDYSAVDVDTLYTLYELEASVKDALDPGLKTILINDLSRPNRSYELSLSEVNTLGFRKSVINFNKQGGIAVESLRSTILNILEEDIKDPGEELEGYWIDPNGKDYKVLGNHMNWISENRVLVNPYISDQLKEYEENNGWEDEDEDYFRMPLTWLIESGWVRVDYIFDEMVADMNSMSQLHLFENWLNKNKSSLNEIESLFISIFDTNRDYDLSIEEIKNVGLRKAMVNFNKRGKIREAILTDLAKDTSMYQKDLVIQKFLLNDWPKQQPVWGSENVKIIKISNGHRLSVKGEPIAVRDEKTGEIFLIHSEEMTRSIKLHRNKLLRLARLHGIEVNDDDLKRKDEFRVNDKVLITDGPNKDKLGMIADRRHTPSSSLVGAIDWDNQITVRLEDGGHSIEWIENLVRLN